MPVITHRVPLEEFATAFDLLTRGEAAKCILFP
jgi:threonine 3-dehydrogenase